MFQGLISEQFLQDNIVSKFQSLMEVYKCTDLDIDLSYIQLPKLSDTKSKRHWIESNYSNLKEFEYIIIADAKWFTAFTKKTAVTKAAGSCVGCINIPALAVYIPAFGLSVTNPIKFKREVQLSLTAILRRINNIPTEQEFNLSFPSSLEEIQERLNHLHTLPRITLDIEARGLTLSSAGIYTIGFGVNDKTGIAFKVDCHLYPEKVRKLLKDFFKTYTGEFIVHNAVYDIAVIIYNLFMEEDFTNLKGQLEGLNVFKGRIADTKVIAYLATNNCADKGYLGLKDLAKPYMGEWSVDVTDVTKINDSVLLEYNAKDCIATWYVYNLYYPLMVRENQENLWLEKFQYYLIDNIRMGLNGFTMSDAKIQELKLYLTTTLQGLEKTILESPYSKQAIRLIGVDLQKKYNATHKKQKSLEECIPVNVKVTGTTFLRKLLYTAMSLPVLGYTKTGLQEINRETLEKLVEQNISDAKKELLTALIDYNKGIKILTTFIPAFENRSCDKNGVKRLTGYFNLGGTVSGRLSSSNPNLQQIPATGSIYAKPVKECFISTDNWLLVGIDFASLEDRISALTTKDSNKMKVYLDGYDGHCLRAYYYFKDKMPDIRLLDESKRYELITYDDASSEIVEVNV